MSKSVVLPLWLVLLAGAIFAWAVLSRIVLPGIRWFFEKREAIYVRKIRNRLNLRLPAIKLIKKRIIVERLLADQRVLKAVDEYSLEQQIPPEIALKEAERYAREIVPEFHAYAYFLLGGMIGVSLAKLLYRVRVGFADEEALSKVDPQSSLVFLMNHRSNMDYILLGYLTLSRAALSFAVGEWARVWPIKPLVKAMGAYFVRRNSGNTLYRRILARYIQMASEGGLVQAVFPEGKLSRDGRLQEPKVGILDYLLRSYDASGERDLVFIPVGVNYDRVLEDRTLLLERKPPAEKKGKKAFFTTIRFMFHNLWLMLRGGWYRLGYAALYFGRPISMREYSQKRGIDFLRLSKEARLELVQTLAGDFMKKIGQVVPVLPVSLVASVFAGDPQTPLSEAEIRRRVAALRGQILSEGAHIHTPRQDQDYAVEVGLRMLVLRHIVNKDGDSYMASPGEMPILRFYASSISHLMA